MVGGSEVLFGACTMTVTEGGILERSGECNDESGGLFLGALGISSIAPGAFDRMAGVTALDLSGNLISSLPSSGLPPNLVSLSLHDNKLTNIEGQLNCPDLLQLSLSRNSIATISGGAFQQLGHLKYLHLDSNLLDSLPGGLFDALIALKGLDLSHNKITCLPTSMFDSLKNLEMLSLSFNQISALGPGINVTSWVEIRSLPKLTRLFLDHNRIQIFPASVFYNCSGLKRIELQSNRIASLPPALFFRLRSLEYVAMAENNIPLLPPDLFKNSPGVIFLDLSDNAMTRAGIADDFFGRSRSLREVYLGGNDLECLPMHAPQFQVIWESPSIRMTASSKCHIDFAGPVRLHGNPSPLPLRVRAHGSRRWSVRCVCRWQVQGF